MAAVAFALLSAPALAATPRHRQGQAGERPRATQPHGRQPTIIGGHTAAPGSWPWAVLVQRLAETGSRYRCTGTVVAPTVVLTAAHCAEDTTTGIPHPPGAYTIVTGRLDVSAGGTGQILGVSQVIVNPTFDPATLEGDAALLVLASPTTAPAIPLAGDADASLLTPGAAGFIAGWGLTDATSTTAPAALQSGVTAVQADASCSSRLGSAFHPMSALCAFDTSASATRTCHGDSGGPLLVRRVDGSYVEVGITSWGVPGCPGDSPSVFTRVAAVSAWVSAQISALPPPAAAPAPAPPPAPVTTAPAPVPPPVAPVTPVAPVAPTPIAPVARPANPGVTAGRYFGLSAQRLPVRLTIAPGGAALSALLVSSALRCEHRRRPVTKRIAGIPVRAPWTLTGKTFARTFVTPGGVRYRIAGSVRSRRRITGTIHASWSSRLAGSCRSGEVGFTVTLR